jgi:hypothetical protein
MIAWWIKLKSMKLFDSVLVVMTVVGSRKVMW